MTHRDAQLTLKLSSQAGRMPGSTRSRAVRLALAVGAVHLGACAFAPEDCADLPPNEVAYDEPVVHSGGRLGRQYVEQVVGEYRFEVEATGAESWFSTDRWTVHITLREPESERVVYPLQDGMPKRGCRLSSVGFDLVYEMEVRAEGLEPELQGPYETSASIRHEDGAWERRIYADDWPGTEASDEARVSVVLQHDGDRTTASTTACKGRGEELRCIDLPPATPTSE